MTSQLLAFMPGPTEMIVVGVVAVLLFGNRLPALARSAGASLMELKRGFKEVERECIELDKDIKDANS